MIHPQYNINISKGDTVTYGNKHYRVQDDGKGFLHIIVFEEGKRKKIAISNLQFFEPGSMADYVFNGWFDIYDQYQLFHSYMLAELSWINYNNK
jgi:hypothetical protein